ncbi:putative Alpha/beta hydrolase fold protein [Candidatus Promineifilum breve]|uniref:Alpha/beta hydrolase fold protein n=1 Tax=Candidatus Promineifilum breve TaxID=1806508 RepID=A0A160T7Y3_9CHLR|nr:alpha/beta fold hydrolase [Candidatus Promineifilum breve]CUS05478.2 putative Alpha/beta hydrolase fold protein [Candidatus Promineifilum breve]
MPTLPIDGREIHYTENHPDGAHATLLLIHGAGGSHLVWPEAIRNLADVRVLALDLPGHGQSAGPGRRNVGGYTAVVESLMNQLALSGAIVAGHSLGSAIALTIAQRSAVPVKGLILLGGTARMPVGEALLGGWSAAPENAAALVAEQGFAADLPDAVEAVRSELLATGATTCFGDFLACERFDFRHNLSAIIQPTLVIAGDEDRLTPLRFSQSLAAGLPHGRLVTLAGAGHFGLIEQPEEVARLMLEFIGQI